ncbi:MAG: RibD family protein [Pseudomonadota bacterium]
MKASYRIVAAKACIRFTLPRHHAAGLPRPDVSAVRTKGSLITLERLAAARSRGAPLVVAQLGQSLDGRIATPTGHSHYVNGDAAITLLHHLRAHVDAVVVGAGTATADNPRLTVRRCEGDSPARVLIDRNRRAGASLKMLQDDGTRRIVFGRRLGEDAPGIEYIEGAGGSPIDPADILADLSRRGLHRVLVEGGAATVSAFIAAGVVSRLCVLVAPLIIGSGPVGIGLPPIETLAGALRPKVDVIALEDGDVVFDCELS